ncbi:hypothetical protein FPT12_07970 [Pseudomonas sp. H3(2019)]|nr:hypothetical protein FPT12_07970 [Pseudomonas sp. H3(2019)]
MILTSAFRLCALIAGYFWGEPSRLTMPYKAADRKSSRGLSPGIRITNDSFSAGRSRVSQTRILRLLARSTQQYCQGH